jgi:ketosteroid isomerase-like protein
VSQNLNTIRVAYADFSRGDWTSLLESLDPKVEWHNPANALEPGVRHGKDSFRVALERIRDSFEISSIELERITEVGDQVVVLLHVQGQGRGSGAPLDHRFGHVFTMRNDKAIRFAWFTNQSEALEAAGLSEQDVHPES